MTASQLIRTKNTILNLGYALKYFSKNIKIRSLGTHLIELTFGNMRRTSYQNDSSEAMINGLVKSELLKGILKKYNIKRKIREILIHGFRFFKGVPQKVITYFLIPT